MKSKKLNILLADDDMDDCIFFKQALEQIPTPTHLITVNDGEQLMDMLINKARVNHLPTQQAGFIPFPDILFLDINMPRKNGFECLAEIKQNTRLKNIPVVMFSTLKSQEKISILFNAGAHIYVHKPGDFAQLKQVITHALEITAGKSSDNDSLKYILNA